MSADPAVDRSRARPRTKASGRRRRGSGGITPVAEGIWRVDVEVSRDPVTGRRRRVSRRVRGSREDAEVALAQLKVADASGRVRSRATRARTVQASLDAYLDDVERGDVVLAKRTIVTSRSARNTMSDTVLADGRRFGDLSLDRLGWEEIEDLYRSMALAGAGAAWIRRCATVLTNALDRARKHGIMDHNPAKDADRPKLVRTKPRSPSEAELRAVLATVVDADAELGDVLCVMAGTGVRMGELLGLQWPEVDLDIAEVHVAWAVSDGGPGVGVFRKETKQSDWRDVPLTQAVTAALRRQRSRLHETYGVEPGAGHVLGIGFDDLVDRIQHHRDAPAAADEAIRLAVALGAEAHLLVLHALVPELRRRISHTATSEYHADAIGNLALVLLDSDLSPTGLATRLISRAHNRTLRAARSARCRGEGGHIAIDPCDPHVLDRTGEWRQADYPDIAEEAAQRADLARFGEGVRDAITAGDVTEAAWTTYRDHRLRRTLALEAGSSTGAERVAAHRAARRLAPLVSTYLRGHAA